MSQPTTQTVARTSANAPNSEIAERRRNAMNTRRSAFRRAYPPFVGLEGLPVRVDVPSRMIRFGHGKTRVTLAWLSGAALACALIGTCLALLRSDVLPFRDAWPSFHGTRHSGDPAGSAAGRVTARRPSVLRPAADHGRRGARDRPPRPRPSRPSRRSRDDGPAPRHGLRPAGHHDAGHHRLDARADPDHQRRHHVGPHGTDPLPTFPATLPAVPVPTTTTVPASTTPDVAAASVDTRCRPRPRAAPARRAVPPTPTRRAPTTIRPATPRR